MISLAVKYRPSTWDDVVEQKSIKTILQNQLRNKAIKNAYLFVGPAGCGKTTCARIFADEINEHQGNTIEMDAASNSGVDDVRNIIQQAKTKSLTSRYKVFIIDECHSISNTGWQAFLKLLEEPPETSVFIFCTTDPQKIPKTILSRVQRYDFQRISQKGIVDRLKYVITEENAVSSDWEVESIEYISKLANGHLRDAITMLDQCFAYSSLLTVENVQAALGLESMTTMMNLYDNIADKKFNGVIDIIETVHNSGHDLKQFIKSFLQFLLDCGKMISGCPDEYVDMPIDKDWLKSINEVDYYREMVIRLIDCAMQLNNDIKWDANPKVIIEARLLSFIRGV